MKVTEASDSHSFRFGRLCVMLYHVGIIGFTQGACAALVYLALVEQNLSAATSFRIISVGFFVAGLVLLGTSMTDFNDSFWHRCITVLCISLSTSIAIFAIKGALLAFLMSSLNEYGTLTVTVYHWRDLAVYLPVCFTLVFISVEARRLVGRRTGLAS